ncbi:MAG: AtpZ/AtpI family protein [Oscillospiraceae bacterium]|nr:AtpZ/AtpI family protein [Oscillospiraceae bacterium]
MPSEKPPGGQGYRRELVRAMSLISQIGVTVAACLAIGVFTGRWLDGLLGTSPWLLIVFSLFGVGAAFKSLIDIVNKVYKE